MKKTTGAKSRKAAAGQRDDAGDVLAYDAEYAQTIRAAFEDGLERHARLVYDALDEDGKRAAAGLDDASAYPPPFNLSFTAQLARERAERFAGSVTRAQWEAASRDEFIKRIAKRETLSVETFDPMRKLSRMTNERGETVEVQTARPLTDRRDVRDDFGGVDWERRGDVYVFTRWRMPSVGVEDVEFFGWRELVEKSGMVLVGSGDGARYYLPRDAEAHAKRKAERARGRERMAEEMEEQRAEAEKLRRDAEIGRAVQVLRRAGVPVAPDAPAPEVTTPAAEAKPKRKRGRPKAAYSSPQARARAAAYVAMVEYAAERPELSGAGARRDCAEEHEGDADYQYFVNEENARKWGQRHGVQFSALVEMCRHDAKAWADMKAKLTN